MNPEENPPVQNLVPPQEPAEPAQTPTFDIPDSAESLKQIRTYQGDVAQAIEGQDESLFSIQQAERARQGMQEGPTPEEQAESRKRIKAVLLLLGSFLLVGAGIAGGWYSYVEFSEKSALPEIEVLENELIPARERVDLNAQNIDRGSLISEVVAAGQEADLPLGEVLHINLIDKEKTNEAPQELTPAQKFLAILEARAPGNLVRAFNPTFMLGILRTQRDALPVETTATSTQASATSTQEAAAQATASSSTSTSTPPIPAVPEITDSVFLIMKLDSFENTFAGMLEWESKMLEDLGPLFSTRGLASNLSSNTPWTDVSDRNKDSRVLYSPDGQVVLIYSFFDAETLVITDSQETLRTVLSRLTNQLLSR